MKVTIEAKVVRRTNIGEEGLPETKNNAFGLATEDRGRQYQLQRTKYVRPGQVKMESMKMEICHMAEHYRERMRSMTYLPRCCRQTGTTACRHHEDSVHRFRHHNITYHAHFVARQVTITKHCITCRRRYVTVHRCGVVTHVTSVSETVRKQPLVKAQTALRKPPKNMAKTIVNMADEILTLCNVARS